MSCSEVRRQEQDRHRHMKPCGKDGYLLTPNTLLTGQKQAENMKSKAEQHQLKINKQATTEHLNREDRHKSIISNNIHFTYDLRDLNRAAILRHHSQYF